MADILIKNMELPCTITIYPNGDIDELIDGKYVTIGKAIELSPRGKIVDMKKVMSKITLCFSECKLQNMNVTPFILSTYMAKVPNILEANNGTDN